jgi:YcxB-like protein
MSQATPSADERAPLEAQLVFTEPLLRRVVRCYRWRRWGRMYAILIPLAVAWLAWLAIYDQDRYMTGFVAALTILLISTAIGAGVALRIQLLRNFRKLGGAPTQFRAEASTFTISSPISTQTWAWSIVTEIWRFPDFWLLMFGRSNFITLPVASTSEELRAFVAERVQAAGGKVS